MSREVVATFKGDKPVKVYEVEYRDSEGEWLPAVGLWANASVSVKSQYPTVSGAKIAARELNVVCGFHTRVVVLEANEREGK